MNATNLDAGSPNHGRDELDALKNAVLETAHEMDRVGLTAGTAGNISARTRDGVVVLTPTATPYAGMTLDDLSVTDLEGKPLSTVGVTTAAGATTRAAGTRAPTTELDLHLACLRRHPDIAAVVHTHPVYATMFAVNHQPIPCVIEEFEFYIGGDVPVCAYHRTGSEALGTAVAGLLGDRAAALMANHGLVVVAASPAEALQLTKLVERAAQIVHGARAMGEPIPLPDRIREEFSAAYLQRRKDAARDTSPAQ